ncbi:MAG: diversity-generating retroelement protein Avd [Planctomycetota bacterium]
MSELPIVVKCEDLLAWLLERTRTFPKHWRHSITNRIECTALDVLERLIEARFEKGRKPSLFKAGTSLETLRLLVRLAHRHHCLSAAAYEHAARVMEEIGRMLGGWRRHARGHHEASQRAL